MQDRIVGPLTMIQFLYAIIGGGFAYGAFSSLPSPTGLLTAMVIALFTCACIFVKINEQPFLKFLSHMLVFLVAPKKMIWQQIKKPTVSVQFYVSKKPQLDISNKFITKNDIADLANKIDSDKAQKLMLKR